MEKQHESIIQIRASDLEFLATEALASLSKHGSLPPELRSRIEKETIEARSKLNDIGSRMMSYLYCESLKSDAAEAEDSERLRYLNELQIRILSEAPLSDCLNEIPISKVSKVCGRNGTTYVVNDGQFFDFLKGQYSEALTVNSGEFKASQYLYTWIFSPGLFTRRNSVPSKLSGLICNPNTPVFGYFRHNHPVNFIDELTRPFEKIDDGEITTKAGENALDYLRRLADRALS